MESVESALLDFPGIIETAVIGKPDQLRGQIIKAFIIINQNLQTQIQDINREKGLKEEIQEFVKQHLAGHAYPREIEFVTSLPKNRSGKIVRRLLLSREIAKNTPG